MLGSTGTEGRMIYRSTATSALGVGVSVSGAYGSFRKSGSVAVSSEDTIGFTMKTGPASHAYQTQFQYSTFAFWCHPLSQPTEKTIFQYAAKPTSFVGGSAKKAIAKPILTMCTALAAGDDYTKNRTVAYEWKTGVDIAPVIGVDLNITTGYTTQAAAFYHNTSTKAKPFCGDTGYPGQTPQRIVLG